MHVMLLVPSLDSAQIFRPQDQDAQFVLSGPPWLDGEVGRNVSVQTDRPESFPGAAGEYRQPCTLPPPSDRVQDP